MNKIITSWVLLLLINFSVKGYAAKNDYSSSWKEIEALETKQLNRSALEKVETLLSIAKAEEKESQIIKCILYKLKLEGRFEEQALKKSIEFLNRELRSDSLSPFVKSVLNTVLADSYWSYYQNNRWNIYERSSLLEPDLEDIETWDAELFLQYATNHYKASVKEKGILQNSLLENYEELLAEKKVYRALRPTVFDLLAHKAIDFFTANEASINRPLDRFDKANGDFFKESQSFVKIDIETKDSLSLSYQALKLFQELEDFHLSDAKKGPIIDVCLKRYKYLKSNSTNDEKDSLYELGLKHLIKTYANNPLCSMAYYYLAEYYSEKGALYSARLNEKEKWALKYAIETCNKAIKLFPNSLGANNCEALKARLLLPTISANAEEAVLPNQPFKILCSYKNVNNIYVKVVPVDFYEDYTFRNEGNVNERLDYYLSKEVAQSYSFEVKPDKDYQLHTSEFSITPLDPGHYVVLISNNSNFSVKTDKGIVAVHNFWVSNITTFKRKQPDGSYDIQLMSRENGSPLKGARVQLWSRKYDYNNKTHERVSGGTFESNEQGIIQIPLSGRGQNYDIEVSTENDNIYLPGMVYLYPTRTTERAITRTHFFTDRAIYRPGQTVHFKGIMLESFKGKHKILPNTGSEVTLFDVNHQKVTSISVTTNDYGSFSGSFVIPKGLLNGTMRISNKSGTHYFSVEEYKRPNFEILTPPIKKAYELNDTVHYTGVVKSFSGVPLSNIKVNYSVERSIYQPYWYYAFGNYRGYAGAGKNTMISSGIITTNDTGGFVVSFIAKEDRSIKNTYSALNFEIDLSATDITGETQHAKTNIKLGRSNVVLAIDAESIILQNEKKQLLIACKNLDDEDINSEGEVEVIRLNMPQQVYRQRLWGIPDHQVIDKETHHKLFPLDEYQHESQISSLKEVESVYKGKVIANQKTGAPFLKANTWKSGPYKITARWKDAKGKLIERTHYFTLIDQSKNISFPTPFLFHAIRSKGEPGTNAKFVVGTSFENIDLIYEVEHQGNIVQKQWIKLNNEKKFIEIPIKEEHYGNFAVHFTTVAKGRSYQHDETIIVPRTNKELDIKFETFRKELKPGDKEQWKINVTGRNKEGFLSELMLSLYDASLDHFKEHNWTFNIYSSYSPSLSWQNDGHFGLTGSRLYSFTAKDILHIGSHFYERLNYFGYYVGQTNYPGMYSLRRAAGRAMVAMDGLESREGNANTAPVYDSNETSTSFVQPDLKEGQTKKSEQDKPQSRENIRTNFNETAFFFPQLETDDKGKISVDFTIPESLTRWKLLGLAHTKDLMYGITGNTLVTKKELMVVPNAPRFFREGDTLYLSAKLSNISAQDISGTVTLELFEGLTLTPLQKYVIDHLTEPVRDLDERYKVLFSNDSQTFKCEANKDAVVQWRIVIPYDVDAITYRIKAKTKNHEDGVEYTIPVLKNRMLVTESMPLWANKKGSKRFEFEKLIESKDSKTLRNHKLTLEYTSNPAWYALQALPYLIEYPYECAEQVFSRYYANMLANHLVTSSSKIKRVLDTWSQKGSEAFISNLEKNQELKSVLLEESPWVLQANSEEDNKRRVALLLDQNHVNSELRKALNTLMQLQSNTGGWPWFKGMREDRFITQHIISGMGHLQHLHVLNIKNDMALKSMIEKAMRYMDLEVKKDYDRIRSKNALNQQNINSTHIQYLYAHSFFKEIPVLGNARDAYNYFFEQAEKYWTGNNRYLQGMIALAMHRKDKIEIAGDIMKALKENSITSEEMGMYWKEHYEGYHWYQAPIEAQAMMIEAFHEVAKDQASVDALKTWLIKSKQTTNWKTTKATTEACYALLLTGTSWIEKEQEVSLKLGQQTYDPKKDKSVGIEAGTGYFKKSWLKNEVVGDMGNVTITKSSDGVSWGALHWQYFEDLDKITSSETNLKITKELYKEKIVDDKKILLPLNLDSPLTTGDQLKVRIEIRVDRNMDYVHIKDMRASCLEPNQPISGYRYQGGLGYYQSIKDASVNFFINHLPKGTYVLEYPLFVNQTGNYSNGISSIQCMYAPEFNSHTKGVRISVEQ